MLSFIQSKEETHMPTVKDQNILLVDVCLTRKPVRGMQVLHCLCI